MCNTVPMAHAETVRAKIYLQLKGHCHFVWPKLTVTENFQDLQCWIMLRLSGFMGEIDKGQIICVEIYKAWYQV